MINSVLNNLDELAGNLMALGLDRRDFNACNCYFVLVFFIIYFLFISNSTSGIRPAADNCQALSEAMAGETDKTCLTLFSEVLKRPGTSYRDDCYAHNVEFYSSICKEAMEQCCMIDGFSNYAGVYLTLLSLILMYAAAAHFCLSASHLYDADGNFHLAFIYEDEAPGDEENGDPNDQGDGDGLHLN